MKVFIALMLLSSIVRGQTTQADIDSAYARMYRWGTLSRDTLPDSTFIYRGGGTFQQVYMNIQHDTIPVVMLITDTASTYKAGKGETAVQTHTPKYRYIRSGTCCVWADPHKKGDTWSESGYEVREATTTYPTTMGDVPAWYHKDYLDSKKIPIQYFVWLSKSMK